MQGDFAGVAIGEGDGAFVVAGAVAKVQAAVASAAFTGDFLDTAHDPLAISAFDEGRGDGAGECFAHVAGARAAARDFIGIVQHIFGRSLALDHGAHTACSPGGSLAIGGFGAGARDLDGPVHLIAGIQAHVGDGAGVFEAIAIDGEAIGMGGAHCALGEVAAGDLDNDFASDQAAVLAGATGAKVDRDRVGEGALGYGRGDCGATCDRRIGGHAKFCFISHVLDHARGF